MKFHALAIIFAGFIVGHVSAQTLYKNVQKSTDGNNRLVESLAVPTGKMLTVEAGGELNSASYKSPVTTLTYAATTDIAMSSTLNTVALTGNITFTTSAKAAGQYVTVRVVADGTNRTLTFPGTWVWVGSTPPATIIASKVGILSLICFGTTDADVVASWVSSL
jgi:hypothetical protein